jgi:hypothetical protein
VGLYELSLSFLLFFVYRLSVESMPSELEDQFIWAKSVTLKEPFCIEANSQTFSLLFLILKYCLEEITKKRSQAKASLTWSGMIY